MASMTFADWLADHKSDRSGNELAKMVGVSQSQVSRWLTGKGYPAQKFLAPLATALEVSGEEMTDAMKLPLAIGATNGKAKAPARKAVPEKLALPPIAAVPRGSGFLEARQAALEELATMALTSNGAPFNERLVKVGELVKILS